MKTAYSRTLLTSVVIIHAAVNGWAYGQEASDPFKRLDRNMDGKLTKDEFPNRLFDRIDTNQDGIITIEEDQAFMRRRPNRPGQNNQNSRNLEAVEAMLDLPYAETDNPRQTLDLYLPKKRVSDQPLPVVVFIHGGAWRAGDKRGGARTVVPLVETGQYVGVSIGYRLTGEVVWPAQIHDCKAAIRWLKANAQKYQFDPDRIGVTGTSAGGHLVAMLGTSGDSPELDGELGGHLDQNSRVACVVDQFGPSDLLSMGGSHNNANSPESILVGGPLQETKATAIQASPTAYVTKQDPPFLFIHGTDDPLVPFQQSELLHEKLQTAGVASLLVPVEKGGHGNFGTPEVAERMKQFFDKHLRGQKIEIPKAAIAQGGR